MKSTALAITLLLCTGFVLAHGRQHGGPGGGNNGNNGRNDRDDHHDHHDDDGHHDDDEWCEEHGWNHSSSAPVNGTLTYSGWRTQRTWCIPDTNNTFCTGETLKYLFEKNQIVPDLLGRCEMRYTIGVKMGFPGRADVIGTYVNKSVAVNPVITLSSEAFEEPAGTLHTFITLDPDASARWNATNGPILHWLVTNVANGTLSTGNETTPFRPPGPAFGNGLHRYVTLLLRQQSGRINVPTPDANGRRQYDLYRLMRTYNLTVLGGTFFFSQF